jgi:hypothetical protein
MTMAVHGFDERLAWSRAQEDAPWWLSVYRRAFPGIATMMSVRDDGWAQRAGIDRIIVLTTGKIIRVDEKVRSRDYPDFALERWSDEAKRKPGWIQKSLDCDFIAYAFVESGTCYLFPTLLLQRAWREFGRQWVSIYPEVRAQNRGYVTVSTAVPRGVVLDAIRESIVVPFASGEASP